MVKRFLSALPAIGAALAVSWILLAEVSDAATQAATQPVDGYETIHNDFYWVDQNGQRVLTRCGCLRQFNGVYYWYGGNPRGFLEQYCYSSSDLVHWTNHGVVFRQDFDANRIDVLYNDTTKQYVMFLKYNGNGAHFAIATADKPEGPFTFRSQTLVDNALIGDMSMFKDDDGTAYLAYVSWAVSVNGQHGIYRLSPDYMTLDKRMYLWNIRGREAPNILKRNGLYYYFTSKTAGIQSSDTNYCTARNLAGPWSDIKPLITSGSKNTWDTQIDFVHPFQGSKGIVYMFAGDRWIKDMARGRNGDYVWLPMEFDGDVPTLNYYQDWDVNLQSGTWRKFDPARSLAVGKAVTASSVIGDNAASHVTEAKTYQNYVNSHWESAATDAQWIMVDLGSPMDINRVILKWGTTFGKTFKIQVSTDSTAWTDVYSTSAGSSYSVTDARFATTTARYVRMFGIQRGTPPPTFGRRVGRGNRGALGTAAGAQPAFQPFTVPATSPAAIAGYSLFDFEVLKD